MDTPGVEKCRSMTQLFIKDSKIVILVYEITTKKSFEELNYWIKTAKEILVDIIIFGIMGAKSDLYLEQEVSDEEAYRFAKENRMKFQYVSAKNDPKGIIKFLEELAFDYLLTKKELNLKKTDLIDSKRDKKKKEIKIKKLYNKRDRKFYLENLNKNYIKSLTKYSNY